MMITPRACALAAAFALFPLAAQAAPIEHCERYAEEWSRLAPSADLQGKPQQFRRDRAFYNCLNMDDSPPLPSAGEMGASRSLRLGYALDETPGAERQPVETAAAAAARSAVNAMATETIEEGSAASEDPAQQETAGLAAEDADPIITGLKVGSPEWAAWCRKHFPKSFDPETGTVIPLASGRRTRCS
jgi:hypothetical protein